MKLNKDVEKFIINEVTSSLSEYDFDSMFSLENLKLKIKEEVFNQIRLKISEVIANRMLMEIKEKMPILDASVNEIVREAIYKVDLLLESHE